LRWAIILSILLADVLIIFLCLTVTQKSLEEDSTPEEEQHLQEPQTSGKENIEQEEPDQENKDFLTTTKRFCGGKWVALKACRMVLHVIIMGFFLYSFTEVVEYPVTFAEAASTGTPPGPCYDGDPPIGYHPNNTLNNFCGGSLTNLIFASTLDNIGYTIGVVVYFLVLIRMKPSTFYSFAFPYTSLFLWGLVAALWFVGFMPPRAVYLLIAIGNVVPYYLEQYNFYFWTANIEAKHFGFFYAIYDLGHSFLHTFSALLLFWAPTDFNSSSPIFSGLLILSLITVVVTYFYSLWFSRAYSTFLSKLNAPAPPRHIVQTEEK